MNKSVRRRVDYFSFLQWPAMVVTTGSVWLIASQSKLRRNWGFWLSLASNGLWMIWGFHDGAWAVVGLQLCLAVLNVRGAQKNSASG